MILAIDVGNTNIVLGAFNQGELVFVSRINTDTKLMEDEYAIKLKGILEYHRCVPKLFDGAIISSVVPPVLPALKKAVSNLIGCDPLIVSPGMKTGVNIKIDNPLVLGADFVCGAVCAAKKYPLPCIVIDMGTATKFFVVDKTSSFIGASILPGVGISLNALSSNTAQLPHIEFEDASAVIGKNTVESMKSGIIFGNASMVDGMIEKFEKALGEKCYAVATGGMAQRIIPYCNSNITIDPDLVLYGLYIIYQKNVGNKS